MINAILSLLVFFIALTFLRPAVANELLCGKLDATSYGNIYGPFDYQDPRNSVPSGEHPGGRISLVENAHFTPHIRALDVTRHGIGNLTGEVVYTLRAFPNHPEALLALSRLERLAGGRLPRGSANHLTPTISADCFFDRAIRFRPNDPMVRFVEGMHHHANKNYALARSSYAQAEALGLSNANFYYNYGLLLTDLRDWLAARVYAEKAYQLGFPLEGLRRRLAAAGHGL